VAVAILHSFWYQKSGETFAETARVDPGCAMAEWGVAMTQYRQLWETVLSEIFIVLLFLLTALRERI
jgi:hypothetical protein